MAYKALYRTYRPNTFDEVAGQEHVVRTLKNAVIQHKIAHAYLFCGPRGTGKTSIAKIFAKAVNCTDEHHIPCMECENCLSITDGTHPDIIEIDAASNNGVEEVRNLIEKVKYAPIKGKYKVYIIDEVHMMSPGAFNALLKTIEEPPAHVIFILATTEPHKVLPTIISRCQRYDFTKVPPKEMIERIHLILEKEQIQCEDEVVRIIAQLSDGGMRDALSILDQCIAYAQNDIKVAHINEIYGILTVKEKLELLSLVLQKNAKQCMNMIQSIVEKGMDIKRLTTDMIDLLKESIIYEYTKDEQLLHALHKKEAEKLNKEAGLKKRFDMIDIFMDTYDKYRTAGDLSGYFEICLLKMMNDPTETIPVQAPVTNTNDIQNVSRETLINTSDIPMDDPYDNDINMEPPLPEPIQETVQEKKYSIEPLRDEFVVQLLVGANKPEKQLDQEHFKNIFDYTMELDWAKEANLLKNGKIMASSETYCIMVFESQVLVNEINEKDKQNEFCKFSKELLKKQKKIFAVTPEQSKHITELFRKKMSEGSLPEPIQFQTKEETIEEKKEPTQEDIILDLFGKENIVITED